MVCGSWVLRETDSETVFGRQGFDKGSGIRQETQTGSH